MTVQHNLAAMNTNRQLGVTSAALSKSTEKLSSVYKITRAGDDAAGLTISEKMRSQVRGLDQASTNAEDGVSLIQSAEGALNETHSILQRMNELAVQGANDTNESIDRGAINKELTALTDEIDRIADTTQFNKKNLLDGTLADNKLQVGANVGQSIDINIDDMHADTIGLANVAGFTASAGSDLVLRGYSTAAAATSAITVALSHKYGTEIKELVTGSFAYNSVKYAATSAGKAAAYTAMYTDKGFVSGTDVKADSVGMQVDDFKVANQTLSRVQNAINNVSDQRSALGALQNRLEHTIANLDTVSENTSAAESRIRDVDMAEEMVEYSKNNILSQAGQSMLAQANQSTSGVLSLLQ